jgi:inosine-uridine nucleoside N-ribohydrolase
MAALLVLSPLAACGERQRAGSARPSLLIDTDVGADDAIALLYLLQDPAVDVRAITVSGTGLVHCDSGMSIVAGLVELTGHPSVPIACGADKPLSGTRAFPESWRTQADGRYGNRLPAAEPPIDGRDAVGLLMDTAKAAADGLTVLTLGPLTNLAAAFAADPGLAKRVDRVVMMAGAFHVGGNVQLEDEPAAAATEWNVYVDPTAAQAVLDTGVDVTFVPIDSQVAVDPFVLRAVALTGSAAGKKVAGLLTSDPFYVSGGFFLWDPLAASAVTSPAYMQTQTTDVSIVTEGDEAGRTIAGSGRPAHIATVNNGDSFVTALVSALDRKPTTFSRLPTVTIEGSTAGGCATSAQALTAGPSVISLSSAATAAGIGSLLPGHSDDDINAYLATSPTAPPDWFPLLTLVQAIDKPTDVYFKLPIGTYDVVCFAVSATAPPRVTGHSVLYIT